ncbi:hypothetical protein A4X09_0g5167 [Tilletia walkeri]|uniref:Uncharacterized protein n=1 Tax=Tilletia walkeri TaxID=117179 RepID=A0A8X7N7H8_9BASI|nr:hypothetical protein A4X09_0g5167 [Tilletia walkeri]
MSSPEPMTNYRSGGHPPKAAFVLDESEDDIDESEDELFDGNESDSEADRLPRKQPDTQAASKAGVNHDHDECIVPFPNGNVRKVFTDTNACPDWSYHADWCWRNTQVLSVEDDDHGEGIYHHKGRHAHSRPPSNKPRPSNLAQLEKLVVEKPGVKAKGLSVGRAKGPQKTTMKIKPARAIDDSLINLGRLSYYRLKFLKKNGIQPADGSRDANFLLFLQMQNANQVPSTGTDPELTPSPVAVRHASFVDGKFAVVLQTDWQASLFTQRDLPAGSTERDGSGGILTDVTFKVFENFYLCTSSVFSHILGRWVPILWTVLRQQREPDFADHFFHLFRSLQEQGFGREEVERLMSGTVDFSQAQRAGFVSAYVRWRSALGAMQGLTSEAARAAEKEEYALSGATLLKGCLFHFRQSVQRVQGNGNFVPKNKQDVFEKLIRGMLNAKSKDPITDYAAQLFDEFPGCYDWLTWWLSCDTAAMLFPGLTKMPLSRWKNLASSISALENLHSIYYLCWRTNMDLMCGLQCLQELAELLEAEHGAGGEGRATRYGKTGIRALRKKVKGRKGAEINDGRAPDANKHLKGSRVPPMAADADEFFSEDDSVQGTGLKIEREENAPEDRPSKRARPNGVGKTATTTISTFVSSTSKSRPQQSGSTARSVLVSLFGMHCFLEW